jgi:hypothetical protein
MVRRKEEVALREKHNQTVLDMAMEAPLATAKQEARRPEVLKNRVTTVASEKRGSKPPDQQSESERGKISRSKPVTVFSIDEGLDSSDSEIDVVVIPGGTVHPVTPAPSSSTSVIRVEALQPTQSAMSRSQKTVVVKPIVSALQNRVNIASVAVAPVVIPVESIAVVNNKLSAHARPIQATVASDLQGNLSKTRPMSSPEAKTSSRSSANRTRHKRSSDGGSARKSKSEHSKRKHKSAKKKKKKKSKSKTKSKGKNAATGSSTEVRRAEAHVVEPQVLRFESQRLRGEEASVMKGLTSFLHKDNKN